MTPRRGAMLLAVGRTAPGVAVLAASEPETNGCAEKLIQTLKEQVLWIERFDTFEQLRAAVRKFTVTYNHQWLLERHSYRPSKHASTSSTRHSWHDPLTHQGVR